MYDAELIELGRGDQPVDLGNRGEVVGGAFGPVPGGFGYTAFYWYDGVVVDLGANWENRASAAVSVNDSGMILGTVEGYGGELDRIFKIDAAGNISYPAPFDPTIDVRAKAVNDAGHIVGVYQSTPNAASIPFFWDGTSTTVYDLVPAWADRVFLGGLNNHGQVAGASREGICGNTGFLWETNVFTGFGTCGDWIAANDINDAAQIVGSMYFGGESQKHAFLFEEQGFTDLGVLEGAVASTASGINNRGWIVGDSSTQWPPSRRAFIYVDSVMYDLNDYISDETWHLARALKINDRGQILMEANPSTGFGGVFLLLTPAGILPVEDLIDLVVSFELPRGIERAFVVKLEHALEAIVDEDNRDAGRGTSRSRRADSGCARLRLIGAAGKLFNAES
jgi:probable HAF family extracellular repeat protein